MTASRQSWIGTALALAIIAAWLALHVYGVFFLDLRSMAHLPQALLLLAVLTWLSVGVYIVAHDAMHGSLCPANPAAGNLIGAVAVWLYAGFTFRRLAPKHHAHHRQPGSADDPDFAAATPDRAFRWYGQFMKTYFGPREVLTMCLRVGIYMLLGARLENILLFFAVPGLISSFQLFYFGTFLPHRHLPAGGAGFPDRHRTRSNEYGYLMSLLTCFHFGYHHEHHLHPAEPWWRLPAVRRP
ncbi:fatty acid desaturase [Noviherbaspirillum suwonense]|jgi:beta-carotene ketolase (CrtW type)|uniref:Beta-carotene ketolase (CrtW type) n=1 Tax=Noviherbaspirillum suwonense TaxID=1224511 RepID=A0ABY1PTT6_9BURK|nr:fatty acid desaturase [Noviherbaspirillum suwonense]SMP43691.1 beta-carotene ketolase (CrtW type) [Noviherbaspirillum suwonense]